MFNRLDYLKIFCVAAERSTFKDAAIQMNVSPQVITRGIKELETELGEILFVRSTRNIKITTFGEQFYHKAKAAIAMMDDVFMNNTHDTLSVKITAPPSYARPFLLPVLKKINRAHPEIRFDVRLSNQISDVVEEKIDIGIRVGHPITDNRFIARSVSKVNHVIVATPELIERFGKPQTIDDLSKLPVTALFDNNHNHIWKWFFKDNLCFTPEMPVFLTDDADAEFEAVLKGIGFGQISVSVAAPYIQQGLLIPVLMEYDLIDTWDVYIYRPQSGPVPTRVRVVFDALVEHFQDQSFMPTRLPELNLKLTP
ncbi:LysR family transcriptional regulator [Tolumonas lignilytica]|uniref:LysR family transcriptional regulator n=1 Tax=Tolumonas lignilytica TaxID=1283284 RepID=UPI0004647959|nr:LysR family transcriptional regulator [Tolumonas lignilytica]